MDEKLKNITLNVFGKIMLTLIIGNLALASYQMGRLVQYQEAHPQTEYQLNRDGSIPAELQRKKSMSNQVKKYMLGGLLAVFTLFGMNYFRYGKDSVVGIIHEQVKDMEVEKENEI